MNRNQFVTIFIAMGQKIGAVRRGKCGLAMTFMVREIIVNYSYVFESNTPPIVEFFENTISLTA